MLKVFEYTHAVQLWENSILNISGYTILDRLWNNSVMAVVIVLVAAAEKLEDVIQIASLSIMLDDQYPYLTL